MAPTTPQSTPASSRVSNDPSRRDWLRQMASVAIAGKVIDTLASNAEAGKPIDLLSRPYITGSHYSEAAIAQRQNGEFPTEGVDDWSGVYESVLGEKEKRALGYTPLGGELDTAAIIRIPTGKLVKGKQEMERAIVWIYGEEIDKEEKESAECCKKCCSGTCGDYSVGGMTPVTSQLILSTSVNVNVDVNIEQAQPVAADQCPNWFPDWCQCPGGRRTAIPRNAFQYVPGRGGRHHWYRYRCPNRGNWWYFRHPANYSHFNTGGLGLGNRYGGGTYNYRYGR